MKLCILEIDAIIETNSLTFIKTKDNNICIIVDKN